MNINFGENLKRLRKERDLTQENLADYLGVTFQAISKWERGEGYPDITTLPDIAAFFGTSVDDLLGINKIEQERKIRHYQDEYHRLWSEHKFDEVTALMKEAVHEFPGNFDLLVRYLNSLTVTQNPIEVRGEVQSIYDMIQEHCTTDSIRIWTKKQMCHFLSKLNDIPESGVDISEAEKVLETMPLMQNSRDIEAMYIYRNDPEKFKLAAAVGLSELLMLTGEALFRTFDDPTQYDEKILESYIALLNAVMPDEDFGKSFNLIIYDYGYLGVKKHLKGDDGGAIKCFEESVRLAKAFDDLPDISVATSQAVKGAEFIRDRTNLGTGKMQDRIRFLLNNRYPLSEEFKNTEAFKKILDSLS